MYACCHYRVCKNTIKVMKGRTKREKQTIKHEPGSAENWMRSVRGEANKVGNFFLFCLNFSNAPFDY